MNRRRLQQTIRMHTQPTQDTYQPYTTAQSKTYQRSITQGDLHQKDQSKWNIVTNYIENGKIKTRSHSANSTLSKQQQLQVSRLRDQKIEKYIYDRTKVNLQIKKRMSHGRCLLQGFRIGDATSKSLSLILQTDHFFELKLSNCSISDNALLSFSNSIKQQPIVHINLCNNYLTSTGILKLGQILGVYPSLVKLNLSNNKIGDALAKFLPCFPNLKILILDKCGIQNNLQDLLLSLPQQTLQSISLQGNKLIGRYITQKSINYFYYNQFKQLRLDDNPLGTSFMLAITNKPKVIGRFSLKVQKLNLSNTNINSQAAGCFLQKVSDPIASLNLSFNNLPQLSITSNLSIFKFTTQLILKDCKLGESFAKSLSLSLRTNGLQHLDISLNNFEYFMSYVAEAVNQSNIVTLIMNKCLLTDKSMQDFDKYLRENKIKHIQFIGNYITNRSIDQLTNIINKSPKLKKFSLEKTLLSYESVLNIKKLILLDDQQIIQERKNNKCTLQRLQTETSKGYEQIQKEIKRVNYREFSIQAQIAKLKEIEQNIIDRIQEQDKNYRVIIGDMHKQLRNYERTAVQNMKDITKQIHRIKQQVQSIQKIEITRKQKLRTKLRVKGKNGIEKKSKENLKPLFNKH